MPTVEVERTKLSAGWPIVDALVAAGLAESKSEARRAIAANSVKLNQTAVSDEKLVLGEDVLDSEGSARLSVGKKRHARLKVI
jgi:tyrosyl-tRNA synthetase